MSTKTERQQKLDDLRALADWLETHPQVPLGYGAGLSYHVDAETDEAGIERLTEIADLLDVYVTDVGGRKPNEATTHYYARKEFGSAEYTASYITKESTRRYREHMKTYDDAERALRAAAIS